jgi:hypothetical protein
MSTFFPEPVPVLTYHRVLPFKTPMSVTIEEFERHLQWLKEKVFHTLSGEEFEQALRGNLDTERAVVITFDDGYFDNYYLATPLLEKYGMTALLFVITGKIKERVERSIGGWNEEGDDRYLSWAEIDLMVNRGVFEIHTHTHTHTHTPFWMGEHSAAETRLAIHEDVSLSIQALLGQGYEHEIQIAWPWAYFRPEWLADMTTLGINICHTMRPGTNFPNCDTSRIRRLGPEHICSNSRLLFSAATSSFIGRGLNTASRVWGGLRGRS